MLHPLISLSNDLRRLSDNGYKLSIISEYLVVSNIPYVTPNKTVKYGALVSEISHNNNIACKPSTHVMMFTGDHPCDKNGKELEGLVCDTNPQITAEEFTVAYSFSRKPLGQQGYPDYYEKVTAYVAMITSHAQQVDPDVTACTHAETQVDITDDPFRYQDNASARVGISKITKHLAGQKIGIIGLGGSGSYLLDLVVKTSVKEIHLFDGDDHYAAMYEPLHEGVILHPEYLTEGNLDELNGLDFVFLCIDTDSAKKAIVGHLEIQGKSFIDVGMDIRITNGKLGGTIRTSTSTPDDRVTLRRSVPFTEGETNNVGTKNVQIADLNALNACFAVIKWKKLKGIYHDHEKEMASLYTIDKNHILNSVVSQVDIPNSSFRDLDSTSGLADISEITKCLAGQKIGIIGLGGSGAYLLDLVSKTSVDEIHLFDGDHLERHNASRYPGAVPIEALLVEKVNYFAEMYKPLRKGVIAHPVYVTEANLTELNGLDFIFLCIDKGGAKKSIFGYLEAQGKSFIDVGMGIRITDRKLGGIIRTSASTPDNRESLRDYNSFAEGDPDNVYSTNIQIVELNALNACLAVIKWKKLNGIYHDNKREMVSGYTIDGNRIPNEKKE